MHALEANLTNEMFDGRKLFDNIPHSVWMGIKVVILNLVIVCSLFNARIAINVGQLYSGSG